jgi:putative endonuclease
MPEPVRPCVYILASRRNGTLYIGVTRDLLRRMWMHRTQPSGFCARYGVRRLVWYGLQAGMAGAIEQEKRMKHWRRRWKLELIEAANPEWQDLYVQEERAVLSLGPGSDRLRRSGQDED